MARKSTYKRGLNVGYTPQSIYDIYESAKGRKGKASAKKEIAREYQRLRRIVQKREARLQASEFALSSASLKGKSLTKSLKKSGQMSIKGMSAQIAEMSRWLDQRSSTIKGAQEIRRETREEVENYFDYKFRNNKEFMLFTQFMDYMRALYKDTFQYQEDDIVNLFERHSRDVLNQTMTFTEFVNTYQNKYRYSPRKLERPTS